MSTTVTLIDEIHNPTSETIKSYDWNKNTNTSPKPDPFEFKVNMLPAPQIMYNQSSFQTKLYKYIQLDNKSIIYKFFNPDSGIDLENLFPANEYNLKYAKVDKTSRIEPNWLRVLSGHPKFEYPDDFHSYKDGVVSAYHEYFIVFSPKNDSSIGFLYTPLPNSTIYCVTLAASPSGSGGGQLQYMKKMEKRIIMGRERVVYKGKYGKQFIKIKGEFVPVSTLKKI